MSGTNVTVLELNNGQQKAITKALEFFKNGGQYFGLFGSPGTGKTFTAKYLFKQLEILDTDLSAFDSLSSTKCCAAPTNKALKVLRRSFGTGINCDFRTIHSLLGKEAKYDNKGKLVFEGAKDNFQGLKLLILDEISMIQEKIVKELIDRIHPYTKVLLLGDPYQLSPVNEDKSLMFEYAEESHELTEIVRQQEGNPLRQIILEAKAGVIKNEKKLFRYDPREIHFQDEYDTDDLKTSKYGYHILDEGLNDHCIRQMKRAYLKAKADQNWDFCKTLCFTNRNVKKINKIIHEIITNSDEPYCVGEPLMAYQPVIKDVFNPFTGKNTKAFIFKVSDECIISGVAPLEKESNGVKWQGYNVTVEWETSENVKQETELHLLSPDDWEKYEAHCDKLKLLWLKEKTEGENAFDKKNALERVWLNEMKLWHNFRHSYACTCHKAQGSTYNIVFVDADDMSLNVNSASKFTPNGKNKMKKDETSRRWYVALSRPTDRIILY